MKRMNLLIGMGMGIVVGLSSAMLLQPKNRALHSGIGRTLHALGEIADQVTDTMGW